MRAIIVLTLAVMCLSVAVAWAEPAAVAPPTPPIMSPGGLGPKSLEIGPKDQTTKARKIRGKIMLTARLEGGVSPASVEFFADGKSLGKLGSAPYKLEFDASTLAEGDHTLKASAADSSGKEVWAAKTTVSVVGSGKTGARPGPAGALTGNAASDLRSGKKPRADASLATPGSPRGNKRSGASNTTKPGGTGGTGKLPEGLALDRTYDNVEYGVSIRYPGKWTFKDQSLLMKSKGANDFWIAFGEYPVEKAKLVVNFRREKLAPGSTAETFAQYNSYVKKWTSTTALGSPAFSTTAKTASPSGVIHRMIIIVDGSALMLNCTDSTGKSAQENSNLFEAMVNSIKLATAEAKPTAPNHSGGKLTSPSPAPPAVKSPPPSPEPNEAPPPAPPPMAPPPDGGAVPSD